jgi:predicted transcriptional regulator YheO
MNWGNPRDVIVYYHVINSIHNNPMVAMSSTTVSGRNAGSVITELALEDLERRVGRKTNDLGAFPARESEAVTLLGTVLIMKVNCT